MFVAENNVFSGMGLVMVFNEMSETMVTNCDHLVPYFSFSVHISSHFTHNLKYKVRLLYFIMLRAPENHAMMTSIPRVLVLRR